TPARANAKPPPGSGGAPLPSARHATAARRSEQAHARDAKMQTHAPFPPTTGSRAQAWNDPGETEDSSLPGEDLHARDIRGHWWHRVVWTVANHRFQQSATRVRNWAHAVQALPGSSTDA